MNRPSASSIDAPRSATNNPLAVILLSLILLVPMGVAGALASEPIDAQAIPSTDEGNLTSSTDNDTIPEPIAPPTITTTPTPAQASPSLTIQRNDLLNDPWQETDTGTFLVTTKNDESTSQTATLTATLIRDNTTVATTQTTPFTIPGEDIHLQNITLTAPHGRYNLTLDLHASDTPTTDPVDTRTTPVDVTLPLGLPPAAYVRIQSDNTTRPALPTEVSANNTTLQVTPNQDISHTVLVYKPWLEHTFGSVTANQAWATTIHQDGTWVQATPPNDQTVTFTTFAAIELGPAFTNGDPDHVRLTDRPMWVTLLEERDVSTPILEDVNETDRPAPGPRVAIDFSDGNTTGQVLEVSAGWLYDLGFRNPVFHYADGDPIPATRTGATFRVKAPHFSAVYIDDFDCDCENFTPPPGWTWATPPPPGVDFAVASNQSVSSPHSAYQKGGQSSTHVTGWKTLPETITPEAIWFDFLVWENRGTENNWHKFTLEGPDGDLIRGTDEVSE